MLSTVKRLASEILGVGVSKLRIKPEDTGRAESALTREDVRGLIKDKVIFVKRNPGFKVLGRRKRKLRGSRRGSMNSRAPRKETWMTNVRAQRKYLNELVAAGNLAKGKKRSVYMRIKGGSFKGKKALLMYLKDNKLYVEKEEKK
ncbi:MAG: 50S ribosomal protein L19e [Candidatus ainarchaeum sp.]|nr:50S ribosomal protein L19e [Candidatus ainarchaeum sp.]